MRILSTKNGVLGGGVVVAVAAVFATRMLLPQAEAAPTVLPGLGGPPAPVDPNAVPVLVELFTSEGCSSCPPADAVLAKLERTQPVAGARIVPLGHHVDYWDRLGFPDPFSSPRATSRQKSYDGLGAGTYTPQGVVDGRTQTVGSRSSALESLVGEAAKRPHAALAIDVARGEEKDAPFAITVRIGALPQGSAADAELVVVLTQNGARVPIPRGENAGLTLEHTAIVRELVVAGPAPKAGGALDAKLKAPSSVAARDLRVVAFVQERGSRRVLGTATRDLAP